MECDLCGRTDTMDYRCRRCGQNFCTEHRLPETHDCVVFKLEQAEREDDESTTVGPWFKDGFRLSNVDQERNPTDDSDNRRQSAGKTRRRSSHDDISTFGGSDTSVSDDGSNSTEYGHEDAVECGSCGRTISVSHTCDDCGERFCADHRLPSSHECSPPNQGRNTSSDEQGPEPIPREEISTYGGAKPTGNSSVDLNPDGSIKRDSQSEKSNEGAEEETIYRVSDWFFSVKRALLKPARYPIATGWWIGKWGVITGLIVFGLYEIGLFTP